MSISSGTVLRRTGHGQPNMRDVAHAAARRWMEKDFMSPSAGDRNGPAGSRGLPACFEAARVREEAEVFHDRVHDAYNIATLPANASLRAMQAFTRRR